jgi:hypothetical protein
MLGSPWPSSVAVLVSVAAMSLMFIGGMAYFRRMQCFFADGA